MSLRRTLDAMGAMVERASSVPLSASCMVNRAEMLALVERARAELPVELDQAAELLVAHQEVIARAEAEAEQLLAQAQADAERMIMESALVAAARARSEQILDAARAEAARLLRECDLYTDNRLAALQADLARTLGQVQRGRDRLRERSELDYLDPLADDSDPLGRDVQVEYEAVERQRARELERERRRPSDDAYDQNAHDQSTHDQSTHDQKRPPVADGSAPEQPRETPDTAGAHLPGTPASGRTGLGDHGNDQAGSPGSPSQGEPGRIPIPVGTGPERRVLDLTAVERAAEHSGLG